MDINNSFFFGDLISKNSAVFEFFNNRGKKLNLCKGQHVHEQGNKIESIYLLLNGIVEEYELEASGQTRVFAINAGRCLIGFEYFFDEASDKSWRCLTDCALISLPFDDFKIIPSAVLTEIFAYTISHTQRLQNQLRLICGAKTDQQIQQIITEYNEVISDDLDFRLTHQILANMLGVSRGYVNSIVAKPDYPCDCILGEK